MQEQAELPELVSGEELFKGQERAGCRSQGMEICIMLLQGPAAKAHLHAGEACLLISAAGVLGKQRAAAVDLHN